VAGGGTCRRRQTVAEIMLVSPERSEYDSNFMRKSLFYETLGQILPRTLDWILIRDWKIQTGLFLICMVASQLGRIVSL
jgi:hypothetical protein